MISSSFLHKGLSGIIALSLLVLSSACDSLKSSHRQRPGTSSVSVAFDPAAMGELAHAMKTLQVRVFQIENDQRAAADGATQRFPIELQKQEYTIRGISLGLREIEVAILDGDDNALGIGSIRQLVGPGQNRTEPLKIKLVQVVRPAITVPVELRLSGTSAAQVLDALLEWQTVSTGASGSLALTLSPVAGSAVNYETDIKPILEENCTGCHGEALAKKKLKLDRFPFTSQYILDNQALMDEVLLRVQDSDSPMPQAGLMDAAALAKLKEWQQGGYLAAAPAAGGILFRGQIEGVRVADLLEGKLTLSGAQGVELLKKDIAPYTIMESAVFSLDVAVDLEDPSVTIPIVVEP